MIFQVMIPYRYIQNCSCDNIVCAEWRRQTYSAQSFGYISDSSKDNEEVRILLDHSDLRIGSKEKMVATISTSVTS